MAADVVGYSRLMEADEPGTLAALGAHRSELIDPLIDSHGGRIVKTMGDGLLLEFASVVDAVSCAIAIQTGMRDRNASLADFEALRFRIGIHLGDVIVEKDDIFGAGVNMAARIEGLAHPDGIVISDDAHRQVRDRLAIAWQDGGTHQVKNISRGVSIWRWAADGAPPAPAMPAPGKAQTLFDGPSIAVLPFDNMSGDPEQAYFADGITEDIITEISKIAGLSVISRNSTFTYKGKATKAQDISRDLGVASVLEGSVRKAGERVRITAQLIDGRSGGHIWAERYDRDLADIFAVQDDVTEKIVGALELNLIDGAQHRKARSETGIPQAYDCVLRGREQYHRFSTEGNLRARELYERAIELDPGYAAAHAGLAEATMHDWFTGSPEALERALEMAQKARELDPALPLVYEALGNILLFKRRYDEAFAAIKTWIEVEPGNADAYANLAAVLHISGEHEQIAALIEKAMRLNPFYPFYYMLYIGMADLMMRRYDTAIAAIRRSITRNPDAMPPHLFLAACYGHLGDEARAREAMSEVHRIQPDLTMGTVKTIYVYKRTEDLDHLIDGLRRAGLQA